VAWLLLASPAIAADDLRLIQAIKAGESASVRTLLAARVNVNAREGDGTTALHWAVHYGNLDVAQQLLRAGADVKAANRFGATPLGEAAVIGDTAIIAALLKAGADPKAANADGQTPLMAVVRTKQRRRGTPADRSGCRRQRTGAVAWPDRPDVGGGGEPAGDGEGTGRSRRSRERAFGCA
jgi:ankyrin repeat protein